MKEALVDVPVLLWVFVRPEKIKQVFEVIRIARPSTLFLVSDGPRDSVSTDKERILASRKVVENIDWECSVQRLYFDINQGIYKIHKITCEFIFKHVDRCIFLEDDVITSVSFFKYCEVLLEKYKNDLRINMISGMNHTGVTKELNHDYFFSKAASIWGFAIWRRTYEAFYDFSYGDDIYVLNRLNENSKGYRNLQKSLNGYLKNELFNSHPASFEFFLGLSTFSQTQLSIIPKKNMVCNTGFGEGGANTGELKKMSNSIQKLFNMKIFEIEFPLKHPKFIFEDKKYEKKVFEILGNNNPYASKVKGIIRQIYFENKKEILIKLFRIIIRKNE